MLSVPLDAAVGVAPRRTIGLICAIRGAVAASDGVTGVTGRGVGGTGDNVEAVGEARGTGALAAAVLVDDFVMARRMTSLSCCTSNDAAVRK